MTGVRTLEDLLRQRMVVDGHARLSLIRDAQGRYQANLENEDRSHRVDVNDDPADALWNVLAPYTMRRRLPSGRQAVIEGEVRGLDDQIDLEDVIAATPKPYPDDLEDLL